jgi:hypothetical protein
MEIFGSKKQSIVIRKTILSLNKRYPEKNIKTLPTFNLLDRVVRCSVKSIEKQQSIDGGRFFRSLFSRVAKLYCNIFCTTNVACYFQTIHTATCKDKLPAEVLEREGKKILFVLLKRRKFVWWRL